MSYKTPSNPPLPSSLVMWVWVFVVGEDRQTGDGQAADEERDTVRCKEAPRCGDECGWKRR